MIVTREQGQRMVVDEYKRYGRVYVKYATGFGKAKAALDAVSTRPLLPGENGLIICHSEPARDDTWPKQVAEWAPDMVGQIRDGQIRIVCWAGLNSIKGMEFKWVIADECHYITIHNGRFFDRNRINSIILLGATEPEDNNKKLMINHLCRGHKLEIRLDTAINSGVLNDYRINVWYITMTAGEKATYLDYCRVVQNAKKEGIMAFIKKAMGERARFIYNLESKKKAAIYLRDQIRQTGKRFIIFSQSIEMADFISPYRYHSKTDDSDYQRFLDGRISELSSIKQIQEGANIDNLQSGLIIQLNSKELNMVQKAGRLLRLPVGQVAKIHVIIVKETVDQNWMWKAMGGFSATKIRYLDLDRDLFDHYQINNT